LAVANYFKKNNFKISWLGTPEGMENYLLNKKEIQFNQINIHGFRGRGLRSWLKLPFVLIYATYQAIKIIKKWNPTVILVMGGYISVPVAISAKILGVHLIIHEQNALVGLSNRVMNKISNVSFSGLKSNIKSMREIGNPIREELYKINNPAKRLLRRKGPLRILVLGGSLGAKQFNEYLPKIFETVNENKAITIIHQSGDKNYDELVKNYKHINLKVEVKKFIHDMDKKYEWADLIIARSGALTVSEICEVGIASILLPYPYAVDNHQLFNAKIIKNKNGGFIIHQENMIVELKSILNDITREECLIMATNVKNKKRQNAAKEIFNYCKKVLDHEK
jgi:UDP-N-acetylglucosamine--N-acetylmuramyl-(pentapeptide) pyrophosphoryl-undecaprenol N-acetylglucosamine transferase|tara:strand:- start:494 stop:1504 length:1011 start_codon:yes stop_codon:yes gene_type:complete